MDKLSRAIDIMIIGILSGTFILQADGIFYGTLYVPHFSKRMTQVNQFLIVFYVATSLLI